MTVDQKDIVSGFQHKADEANQSKTIARVTVSKILGDSMIPSYKPDTETTYSAYLEDFPEINDPASLSSLVRELQAPAQDLHHYFTRFEKFAFTVGGRDLGGIWIALLNTPDVSIRKLFDSLGLNWKTEVGKMVVSLATRQMDSPEIERLNKFFSGPSEVAMIYSDLISHGSSPVPQMLELVEASEQIQSETLKTDEATRDHFRRYGKSLPLNELRRKFFDMFKNLMVSLQSSLSVEKNTKKVLLRSLSEALLWIKLAQGIRAKDVFKDPEMGVQGKTPLALIESELVENLGGMVKDMVKYV